MKFNRKPMTTNARRKACCIQSNACCATQSQRDVHNNNKIISAPMLSPLLPSSRHFIVCKRSLSFSFDKILVFHHWNSFKRIKFVLFTLTTHSQCCPQNVLCDTSIVWKPNQNQTQTEQKLHKYLHYLLQPNTKRTTANAMVGIVTY